MDRQAIIGFVLIAAVFMAWMYFSMPDPQEEAQKKANTEQSEEQSTSDAKATTKNQAAKSHFKPSAEVKDSAQKKSAYGTWFSHLSTGEKKRFTVTTDLYTAEFSTHGGGVARWTLNEYSTWNDKPLQLVDWQISSDINLFFGTADGKLIDTRNVYFDFPDYPEGGSVVLSDSSEYVFRAILPVVGDSAMIIKTFTLRNGTYSFGLDVEMRNMGSIVANNEYQLTLHSLNFTEKNSVDEATFSDASAFVSNDRQTLDADSQDELHKDSYEGKTHWISTHSKYFLNAIIAEEDSEGEGVYFEGVQLAMPNEGVKEVYQASMIMDYRGKPEEKKSFKVFYGPMKYDLLKSQHEGLEQVMSLGWDWIIRPFSEYLVIPLFTFLHGFIPNYGFVIIIFSIIIKIILYPLTKKSMQSMKKMQKLQPKITEMKERTKDDQQKQSAEMMKLYKDYGVNPAGSCLPMMLQMPILFALFTIFRSTIELRHEPFIWWITDMSAPDIILRLPFTIPIANLSYFSGLALLMSITMFIQQKQSTPDPRQKAMIYMMPVMFWILFNSFPSGLNLYYFMFNLLSIIQQWIINKQGGDEELVKVKRKNKKGWTDRMMEQAQQKQKAAKKR
jgi:YidC/Oxa1 family membrane protein insertase